MNQTLVKVFQKLDTIYSVGDMANVAGLSTCQLQRNLKYLTGFKPHDFLKVLRLQKPLNGEKTWSYAVAWFDIYLDALDRATQFRGNQKCLDVINGGPKNNMTQLTNFVRSVLAHNKYK